MNDLHTQPQREALVQLLLLARYVDQKLSLSENDVFRSVLDSLSWESGTSKDLFVQQGTARIRASLGTPGAKEALLTELCAVFEDASSRGSALDAVRSVLRADGVVPSENAFLLDLQKHLHSTHNS